MRLRKASVASLLVILGLLSMALGVNSALAAPASVGVLQEEREEIQLSGKVLSSDEATGSLEVEVQTADGSTAVYIVWVPEGLEGIDVGDQVEVEGYLEADGTVTAISVVETGEDTEDPADDEDEDTEDPADDEDEDTEDPADDEDEEGTGKGCFFCVNQDFQHPVGRAIALTFDVPYEQVMEWFCEGRFGFGQIMLALQTARSTQPVDETPAEEPEETDEEEPEEPLGLGDLANTYLTRRARGEGWGQIWKDVGRRILKNRIRYLDRDRDQDQDQERDQDRDGTGEDSDEVDEVEPTRTPTTSTTANRKTNGGSQNQAKPDKQTGKPASTGPGDNPAQGNKPAVTGKPDKQTNPSGNNKTGKPGNGNNSGNNGRSNKGGRGR